LDYTLEGRVKAGTQTYHGHRPSEAVIQLLSTIRVAISTPATFTIPAKAGTHSSAST